ncbi:MAG: DUF1330 domain-containing protein [Betaproteobacteria bacterium]|jgi:uncharacterized protein (DUF1330 family)|nr:DUF1330 domain-containing protein [Betaproteobacteria bacterium]
MAAYVITDIKVSDVEKYKGYQALTPGAIAAAGGEFLARGGRTEVLEGDAEPGRVVVLRFDSMEAARAFYHSAGYVAARAARAGATERFNMFIVEGI